MSKPKAPKHFATEADLCAAFIAVIGDKWTPYAETGGWDILLVRKVDGFQVGVQAKLKLNLHVINQAIEDGTHWRVAGQNPDCRAVLVPPDARYGFERICGYVGLTIIRMRDMKGLSARYNPQFYPSLPSDPLNSYESHDWYEMATVRRHKLPPYVPDVRAGSASPVRLTDWKIKAIRIAVTLELRGHLTRRDFAHHQIDHRRWLAMGWLKAEDGRYVRDCLPDFEHQHPVVYKQIKAEAPKWLPKTVFEPAPTARML